ncbi:MAG: glycine cleavage system aminomethyltransferase GcvT [Candidatus Eremiobacteraeota bacterium]|nr:glycine cleavage system aminomethyltransferase GcvT [Candidatus Eremiobacteraeota bacterium]
MAQIKKTPLYDRHVEAGAKMVEFAGYLLPLQYTGIMEEHEAVRTAAGLFDLTHMGELEIRGDWSLEFVQYLITNDVNKIPVGGIVYSTICNEYGGILDDVLVYRMEDRILLIVNAANKDKIYRWIMDKEGTLSADGRKDRCLVVDKSQKLALIAIQGPKSEEILQRITPVNLSEIKYYNFVKGKILDTEGIISRTGYTGEDGFELYVANEDAVPIWDSLMVEGEEYGLKPVGLGARDTLRLEAKFALYGHELNEERNPVEVGLKWVVGKDKPIFIGKTPIMKVIENKPERKLIGFEMKSPGIPRQDCKVFNEDDEEVGIVTSGTFSPTLKKAIGLALVNRKGMKVGKPIKIQIRKKLVPAMIVKTPFYKGSVKRNK